MNLLEISELSGTAFKLLNENDNPELEEHLNKLNNAIIEMMCAEDEQRVRAYNREFFSEVTITRYINYYKQDDPACFHNCDVHTVKDCIAEFIIKNT